MSNLLNLSYVATAEEMIKGPKVYFRGVNRIHINRFKAYVHILSNRLRYKWQVTDDISKSNAIATYEDEGNSESTIKLSLYAEQPNLKPPAIGEYKLAFDEKALIKQLNSAGRKLSLAKKEIKESKFKTRTKINISSHSKKLTDQFCLLLKKVSDDEQFKFVDSSDILQDDSTLFIEQLLFVVDPINEKSLHAYYEFEQQKVDGLTVNEMTVVVLKRQDEGKCEDVFDQIYDTCDESTQVILLDIKTREDIRNFISYL
jgi:hypothetical protein